MVKVELVLENATPNKKNPFYMEDSKFIPKEMKSKIVELTSLDDLFDFKKKREMINFAYSELFTKYVLSHGGKPYTGRMALVAYDEYLDFPVWVAVGDNRFGRNLKMGFYDPYQKEKRREFSWAVRKEENKEY